MDKLSEIMAAKRHALRNQIRPVRDQELERLGRMQTQGGSFLQALAREDRLSVIAEIKRKSPSAGTIAAATLDAVEQAREYINAEADCLSILTDSDYFGGSLQDLWDVVEFLECHNRQTPCLRKDFMLHPVQVVEAAEAGARCILIIVRALEEDAIKALRDAAGIAGLDAIYEIHEERELEKALKFAPKIIGVNNRDLKRFKTDLAISELLIPQIPDEIIKISESGIFDVADAERASACGADAILVGEALMKSEDPEKLIEAFHQA
ncbi:indole-3-glycerol phosphate synthase TrpC [Coraliomargarita sp. SDUM461004]|uniref:indole-3-glycerol-phosphate synthase n=1 Tax=Thalassobacterium sedimentorum TaxID=3041258 RepID=A0ABU1AEW8_9BACT|nr:indole-3-glycerol phosphate synthase TrpC [Coraliomargarita sp. SDUM461004]MDQ8193329.1 indole-3-glycerol phosphate synthase TrpC [Coraliomargarita sp. SDUM461004]